MRLIPHGAACCGIRHIYNMDNGTEDELVRLIAELDALQNVTDDAAAGRLIEIILSSRQVGDRTEFQNRNPAGGWPVILARHGFRLVSRFHNANSANDCFVFHRVPHFKSLRPADLPFEWDHLRGEPNNAEGGPGRVATREVVREVPAPAAPVRVVHTTYHNVLRAGRGAGWPNRQAAEDVAPRARQIDRLDVMSDGTVRWSEDV